MMFVCCCCCLQQMAELVGGYMATDNVKFLKKCVPLKVGVV